MAVGLKRRPVRPSQPRVVIVRDIARARLPISMIRTTLAGIMSDEGQSGTVQLIVVGDVVMRRLNRRFKGRDRTTDVLSFPMIDDMPGTKDTAIVGEIYCNYSHCKRWVKDNGGTIADELLRLAVHGCLHLLGYDHHTPGDHRRMLRVEDRYVEQGGLIRARVRAGTDRGHD